MIREASALDVVALYTVVCVVSVAVSVAVGLWPMGPDSAMVSVTALVGIFLGFAEQEVGEHA